MPTPKASGPAAWNIRSTSAPATAIYFGKDGASLVILIGGGAKKRQNNDIAAARACWADY
jgi:putative addiction module killer protein